MKLFLICEKPQKQNEVASSVRPRYPTCKIGLKNGSFSTFRPSSAEYHKKGGLFLSSDQKSIPPISI
jgi:hypothetical protein